MRSERACSSSNALDEAPRIVPVLQLGLPLRARLHTWLAASALLVAYVATMARDLSLYDSPELALAAVVLGLGHPPGQPLHTLLGHALTFLPVSAGVAAALASALPGALCVVPATSLAQQLTSTALAPRLDRALPWLLAAFGLLGALWEPATRVEVYALATFLALWALARLAPATRASRDVFAAALALGLCAAVNPMIALCVGLSVAPSIVIAIAKRTLSMRALPLSLLGGALGLMPYVYVPLIAQRTSVFVWGAPRDAASLSAYLLLADYDHNHQLSLAMWTDHVIAFVPHAVLHGLAAVILVGLLAHAVLGTRWALGRSTAPVLLALLVAQISFNVVWSLEVPDYDGYLATALWLLAAGAFALCAELTLRGSRLLPVALGLLLVGAAWLAPPAVFARTRHRDHVVRALAERVLHEAPGNAVVISNADAFSAALLYLQEVERQRPDVVVLCYGLASSSWHWERIYRQHPDLPPFALRGPGGRDTRIARFLAAVPAREVRIESLRIAESIRRPACSGGLYLRSGPACEAPSDPKVQTAASELIAAQLASVGYGSPSVVGALALTAESLGQSLWRLNEPRGAFQVLLAGVPRSHWPQGAERLEGLERAPRIAQGLPSWRRNAALGDPARNLFIAGILAGAAGRTQLAADLVNTAARLGLPEAVDLVSAP